MKKTDFEYLNSLATFNISSVLSKQAIFRGLSPKELSRIAQICETVTFQAGETVFEDTSPGRDLYLVLSGKIDVNLEAITPHEVFSIITLGEGEIVGEFALIDSGERSATATCVEDTELLVINGERLHELFEEDNHIGYVVMRNIAQIICARIRRTNRRLLNALRVKLF